MTPCHCTYMTESFGPIAWLLIKLCLLKVIKLDVWMCVCVCNVLCPFSQIQLRTFMIGFAKCTYKHSSHIVLFPLWYLKNYYFFIASVFFKLYNIPCGCDGSPNNQNPMCELYMFLFCMFSQTWSHMHIGIFTKPFCMHGSLTHCLPYGHCRSHDGGQPSELPVLSSHSITHGG